MANPLEDINNDQIDEQLIERNHRFKYLTLFNKDDMRKAYRAGYEDGFNDGQFQRIV